MKKLLELRQQKAALKTQMRSMLDKADSEKRSLNDEEGKLFDELRAQSDALEVEITRLEAVADDQRNLPGTSVDGKGVSNDELRHYIMTGDTRSLTTLVQADGGYTVIPELDKEIMRQLQDDSVMRSIATVKTTKTNEYQKLVSVGGATVNRGTEGEARTETSTPKMERVDIKLNPIYAYPKTTQEILDFSEVDILGWLSSEISDTFSATEENDFVNGDGTKKSKGFLAYPRAATSDKARPFGTLEKMETAAVTSDGLIDLLYKLKAKYRKNAVWVMNSNTAATLQKLKNGNGDYIWRDRLVAGSPDTLLGRPVQYLETMPDADAGEAFLAVGDFKRGYFIVDHTTGVRIAIQQGIAMAAANPFPYNLAAMASVAASTAGIVSNIAAVGMAHDGIDAVPETGTWLLQKGERVVTANTSAKLDATLNRVAQQSTSGNQISQEFNFNVNGDPSDAQIAMMKKAAADGAKMGYQKAVNSVITGQGDLHKALMTKTNSGRKIG